MKTETLAGEFTRSRDNNALHTEPTEGLAFESDRGCVLVAAAYLDESLFELFHATFSQDSVCQKKAVDPMFTGLGPLSTFSAKIKLAYALELIDADIFSSLETIRKIRNEFAHTFSELTFDTPSVADRVKNLHVPDGMDADVDLKIQQDGEETITISKYRFGFAVAAAGLIGYIHNMTHSMQNAG